jgi:hypothetical protein
MAALGMLVGLVIMAWVGGLLPRHRHRTTQRYWVIADQAGHSLTIVDTLDQAGRLVKREVR